MQNVGKMISLGNILEPFRNQAKFSILIDSLIQDESFDDVSLRVQRGPMPVGRTEHFIHI